MILDLDVAECGMEDEFGLFFLGAGDIQHGIDLVGLAFDLVIKLYFVDLPVRFLMLFVLVFALQFLDFLLL